MGVGQITMLLASNVFSDFEQVRGGGCLLDGMDFLDEYSDCFSRYFEVEPDVSDRVSAHGDKKRSIYWNVDNDVVNFFIEGGVVKTIFIRINLVRPKVGFLEVLCDFAASVSCVFVSFEDQQCVEPDELKLRELIAASRATMLLQYI